MNNIDQIAIVALKLLAENDELVIMDGLTKGEMEKDPHGSYVLDSGFFYYLNPLIDSTNDRYRIKDSYTTLANHSYRLAKAMLDVSASYTTND